MAVKILHGADFHLDSAFAALTPEQAAQRRREQRELLYRLAELARQEQVQLVLLAGDLLDSGVGYGETLETLSGALGAMPCRVFLSPGNHDWYSPRSPYATMTLPENVTVFTRSRPVGVVIPELSCRVWGAAFLGEESTPVLRSFTLPTERMEVELMVLHGDLGGGRYGPIRREEIAASGLDYLALGHVHTYSGIQRAGETDYAYPGCPEGRGFDEAGAKGVLVGTVSRGKTDLRFVPMSTRQYEIVTVPLGEGDPLETILAALPGGTERDVYRLILTGQTAAAPDLEKLNRSLESRFFALQLQDRTTRTRDIWQELESDTLRGLFLRRMKKLLEAAGDEPAREEILRATRLGLAALERREEGSL